MILIHQLILEAAGEGIFGLDAEGLTTFANPATERLTGWTAEELIGRPQHALIHHSYPNGDHYPKEACPIYMALLDGVIHRSDSEIFWRKDGTCFPVSYVSSPIIRDGKACGAVVLFQDITDRKRLEAWEKTKSSISPAISSHAPLEETLTMIARGFIGLHANAAILLFLRQGVHLQLAAHARIPEGFQLNFATCQIGDPAFASTRAAELGRQVEFGAETSPEPAPGGEDSSHYWELSHAAFTAGVAVPLLSSSGKVLGVVSVLAAQRQLLDRQVRESIGSVCDMARLAIEHSQLHAELVRQSQYDRLTGLPNRILMEDRLEQALVQARRNGHLVAVCCLDLDEFKQINDSLGHSVGDSALQHVARVLRESVRDIDTVARQGGDEFLIVLPDLKSEKEAEDLCERILLGLRQPVVIGDTTHLLTASMGRSIYPDNGDTASILLKNADIALFTAKSSGRDRVQQFNLLFSERLRREIELQRELRYALDRNQFSLVYQPLFTPGKQIDGFEALLRWVHPTLGPISPGEFIPLAERSGLIVPIGEWVLDRACSQAQEWNRVSTTPIRIFVNASGAQLNRTDFASTIAGAMARSGLAANLLEIEITETWVVSDTEAASTRLRSLRELGVCISIDDFGSGNASFSYLQQLPVDTIKIDRTFIARLDGTAKGSAIARAIIALAEQLDLQTVAEGIETESQFAELRETKCSLYQGFLLARPMDSSAAFRLLKERQGALERPAVNQRKRVQTAIA